MDNKNIKDQTAEDFLNKLSGYILSKNLEKLFSCFSKNEKNKETVEKFKKFFANPEIMAKIIDFSFEKEETQDNSAKYSAKIKEKSGLEYPLKIKIKKEGKEWKVVDMELIPLPYDFAQ